MHANLFYAASLDFPKKLGPRSREPSRWRHIPIHRKVELAKTSTTVFFPGRLYDAYTNTGATRRRWVKQPVYPLIPGLCTDGLLLGSHPILGVSIYHHVCLGLCNLSQNYFLDLGTCRQYLAGRGRRCRPSPLGKFILSLMERTRHWALTSLA